MGDITHHLHKHRAIQGGHKQGVLSIHLTLVMLRMHHQAYPKTYRKTIQPYSAVLVVTDILGHIMLTLTVAVVTHTTRTSTYLQDVHNL